MLRGDTLRDIATIFIVVAILATGVFGTQLIQRVIPNGPQSNDGAQSGYATEQIQSAPTPPASCNDLIEPATGDARGRYEAYYACESEHKERDNARWAFWQAAFGLVSLVLFGFTVVYAHRAWEEARKAANATMNTDRAWLLFSEANLTGYESPTDDLLLADLPFAPITFTNVGNSLAWVKRVRVRLRRIERGLTDLSDEPEYQDWRTYNFVSPIPVLKDKPFYTGASWEAEAWTPQDLAELRRGRFLIVLYGIVEYTDVYERPHETQFGYVWNDRPDVSGAIGPRGFHSRVGGRGVKARYNYHT